MPVNSVPCRHFTLGCGLQKASACLCILLWAGCVSASKGIMQSKILLQSKPKLELQEDSCSPGDGGCCHYSTWWLPDVLPDVEAHS